MPDSRPTSWHCNKCGEHVDPTMALCWNCGHDRQGVAQPAAFVDQFNTDTSRCKSCEYDLQGNADAEVCPECGEPVPWQDCEVCEIRMSKTVMAEGCPACKAKAMGFSFIPEVERKQYDHCPSCQYDLRGNPGLASCPECGCQVGQGRYETVLVKDARPRGSDHQVKSRNRVLTALAFGLPVSMFCLVAAVGLSSDGTDILAAWLCAFGGVGIIFCMILLLAIVAPPSN